MGIKLRAMLKIILSTSEKASLEASHKRARDLDESDRLKAILLRSEGWSSQAIAQALRKSPKTIRVYCRDYVRAKKKKNLSRGGSSGKLNNGQTAALIKHLTETLYQHNHQIVSYIKAQYGVDFTIAGLHKWLHRHGFVYKKPKGHPYKADTQLQEAFINTYNELKATVPAEEPILFGDGVHPTQATKLTYGWIKKGTEKAINTTASRTRLNIVGAIELGAIEKAVITRYDTINAENIVDFMTKLRARYPDAPQLHWIIDGAGYHKAKIVQDKAKELSIKIHFLPPYSPNLNPIERLWKVMNKHARNNRFFTCAKEFRQKIDEFFEKTLPEIASSLDSTINDNFQRL